MVNLMDLHLRRATLQQLHTDPHGDGSFHGSALGSKAGSGHVPSPFGMEIVALCSCLAVKSSDFSHRLSFKGALALCDVQ